MSSDIQDDSVQVPFESPTAGIIEFANRDRTAPDSVTPGGSAWPGVIAKSTDNGGSPFTGDKVTDAYVPSMLAAKGYIDSSVAGKRQGAAVGLIEAEGATIAVVPGVKSYVADFSEGSEAVSIAFDLTGISGAFGFDLWVTPSEGYAVAFPAGIVWFDSMGPVAQTMRDSDKRYLFRFDSFDGDTVYGRFVGSVDREA